jgi:hypothetical protein
MAHHFNLRLRLENYSFEQIQKQADLLYEMEEYEQADKLYQYLVLNDAILT